MSNLTPKERARSAARTLGKLYPDALCPLTHADAVQLLVATILSAQCTDARVNQVTPALFKRYPTVRDFATADQDELEGYIKSTGFFRNKAKNIRACCAAIVERFGGEVPRKMEDLVTLPGVGRKTANVVLSHCFDTPGITVDTHVQRLSGRLGLTEETDPVKIEHDLMKLLPAKEWSAISMRLIFHGRQVCHARTPKCSECKLRPICSRVGVTKSA